VRAAKHIIGAAVQRLASAMVRCMPVERRASLLERLDNEMITEASIRGATIRFYTGSQLLLARATRLLFKEEDTIRWIDDFENGAIFWDIGANVGVYTLYAAVRKGARVLAFEPSSANFRVLSRNIEVNNLSDRVTAYCLAFSNCTQLGVLNLAAPEMGGALSQFGQMGETSRYATDGHYTPQGMLGFTIDEFVTRFRPPIPTYIKLDVDGLELPILAGAKEILCNPCLRSLMVELTLTRKSERDEAVELLKSAGLHLVSQGRVQGMGTEHGANHLFKRHPASNE
jgi:FkbM family methyltransferase